MVITVVTIAFGFSIPKPGVTRGDISLRGLVIKGK
jgi:hypothetical protein